MDRKPNDRPTPWPVSPKHVHAVAHLAPRTCNPDARATETTNLNALRVSSRTDHLIHTRHQDEPLPVPVTPLAPARRPGILVVDDDVGIRALLSDVLWQEGFIVWLAGNGLQALELYQELRAEIDVVLLDIQMPHMDGPQTLTAMRRLCPGICCCFMTADGGFYTERDLFARGAVHIFRKPFRLHEIAQALWDVVTASTIDPAGRRSTGTSGDPLAELFLG
jgi:CheY-like chemotaxis protein